MRAAGAVVSDALVGEVAAAVGLAEGEAGVRDVLGVLGRRGPLPTRAISRATGLPVPIVAAVCGELRTRGVVARERPSRLTPLGRELFASGPAVDVACPACEGRGLRVPEGLGEVARALAAAAEAAPPARGELDQAHCTVETKLRRALALHEAGALAGKRILLLGDDDLTALAIDAVARRYGFAESIRELAVVDVDPAVLRHLGRRLGRTAFRLTCVEHDLREPLPPALVARFDTVFTDPPYTLEGAELFLSRAQAALVPAAGGHVFLAFGPKPPDETLRLQSAIAFMGFAIRRLDRNFNEYLHAGILGGTSHLYHLVAAGSTRPLVAGTHTGGLYTGESRAPRPYRCASCGTVQRVGRGGRWTTVDALRTDGCPECGATRFRPAAIAAR